MNISLTDHPHYSFLVRIGITGQSGPESITFPAGWSHVLHSQDGISHRCPWPYSVLLCAPGRDRMGSGACARTNLLSHCTQGCGCHALHSSAALQHPRLPIIAAYLGWRFLWLTPPDLLACIMFLPTLHPWNPQWGLERYRGSLTSREGRKSTSIRNSEGEGNLGSGPVYLGMDPRNQQLCLGHPTLVGDGCLQSFHGYRICHIICCLLKIWALASCFKSCFYALDFSFEIAILYMCTSRSMCQSVFEHQFQWNFVSIFTLQPEIKKNLQKGMPCPWIRQELQFSG